MDVNKLDSYLRQITDSENRHLMEDSDRIPKRYDQIKYTMDNNKKVYEFTFDSVLKDANISIIKESRFIPIPLHRHSVIEINYIYSGKCTQIINGKDVLLSTGDICILDRNTPHEVLRLEEDDIVIAIDMKREYFTDGFLHRMPSNGIIASFIAQALNDDRENKSYILFRTENDDEIRMMFERLICEYLDHEKSKEVIDAWMTIILSKLLQSNKIEKKYETMSKSTTQLFAILQYLEDNYKTVTLANTAEMFGYNANYFSNYLKYKTGYTFHDLILKKKLAEFCFYLVNTETQIYTLIQNLGYENQSYFFRKFKEVYHLTPNEYREQYSSIER